MIAPGVGEWTVPGYTYAAELGSGASGRVVRRHLLQFFADDLRHSGELFVVSGILLSGLAFLAWALLPRLHRYLDLRWIGAGVVAGLLLGTVLDRAALGLGVGLVLGLAVSILRRRRVSAHGGQGK